MSALSERINLAKRDIARLSEKKKNEVINKIADALLEKSEEILKANFTDLTNATQNDMAQVMLDRLMINQSRIETISAECRNVARLHDPIGETMSGFRTENGLDIRKIRVPLGAVGIIYESRPNVTVDAAALCIKSSNAVLLRGGKDASATNAAICSVMREAIQKCGVNPDIITTLESQSHEAVLDMIRMKDCLDLIIPRGGGGLIKFVVENATVPVIETGVGNCHVYVDKYADLEMAANIVYNAKTSRPSVCNACETLLVHKDAAKEFLPMAKALLDKKSVALLGCEKTREILGKSIAPAADEDYKTEFLDYILAVKVVDSLDEAIAHITEYSTGHSETIVTSDIKRAEQFTREIDSAVVYVNASTRFTDGEQFGFGAEIGISTQKTHARGPMGLAALTSYKYVVYGDGQIR